MGKDKTKLSLSAKLKIQEILLKSGIPKPESIMVSPKKNHLPSTSTRTEPAKIHVVNGNSKVKKSSVLINDNEKRNVRQNDKTMLANKSSSPVKSNDSSNIKITLNGNKNHKSKDVLIKNYNFCSANAKNEFSSAHRNVKPNDKETFKPQPTDQNFTKTKKNAKPAQPASTQKSRNIKTNGNHNEKETMTIKSKRTFKPQPTDHNSSKTKIIPKSVESAASKGTKRKLLQDHSKTSTKKQKLLKSSMKNLNNFIVTDLQPNEPAFQFDSEDSNTDSYIDQFFDSADIKKELPSTSLTIDNSDKKIIEPFNFDQLEELSSSSESSENMNNDTIVEVLKSVGVTKLLEEFVTEEIYSHSSASSDSDTTEEFNSDDLDDLKNSILSDSDTEKSSVNYEDIEEEKNDLIKNAPVVSPQASKLNSLQVFQQDADNTVEPEEDEDYESFGSEDTFDTDEDNSFSEDYDDDTYEEDEFEYLDDDEIESLTSNDDVYNQFLNGKWDEDSNDDEDYTNDDIYISKSEAKYSAIPENETYQFDSDASVELLDLDQPPMSDDSSISSKNSCPELVPIHQSNSYEKELHAKMVEPLTVIIQPGPSGWLPCPFQNEDDSISDTIKDSEPILLNNVTSQLYPIEVNLGDDYCAEIENSMNNDDQDEDNDDDNDETSQQLLYNTCDKEDDMDEQLTTTKSKSKFFNSTNSQHVLLLLKDVIYFHGILQIKLIAGSAEIFGYQLEWNQVITINSPRGHSYVYIKSTESLPPLNDDELCEQLIQFDLTFLQSNLNEIIDNFNETTDAILLLERSPTNHSVNMIKKYMKQAVFPIEKRFNRRRQFYSTESILDCQFFYHTDAGLEINKQWLTNDVQIETNSRIIVTGGKGVGKSTLIRYLINRNIKNHPKMLLIDLDIGQPELFVPQTISATIVTQPILGVGYLRNPTPTKALLFGEINVLISPVKYFTCVCELLKYCRESDECHNMPWIVNTMGYSRGFGSELTAAILHKLCPTHVVQIDGRRSIDNFNWKLTTTNVNEFKFNILHQNEIEEKLNAEYLYYNFKSMSKHGKSKEWNILPKDLRMAMILSRLGNILKYSDGGDAQSLTEIQAICASICDLDVIVPNEDKVNADLKLQLLNGNLVYLCRRLTNPCNDENIVECLGIGIVRNVDFDSKKIYLLPAMPMNELINVNVLAICSIPLPNEIILNQSNRHTVGELPYVYNTNDAISSMKVVQQTFRPERFTQGNHVKLID